MSFSAPGSSVRRRRATTVTAVACFFLSLACEKQEGDGDDLQPAGAGISDGTQERVANWRTTGTDEFVIRVSDETIAAELEAAAVEARESAESARLVWKDSILTERRHRWMVRWAAPVAGTDSEVEHVWVRPLEWSPFRIEGVLLSDPGAEVGFSRGDLVSFPIEELSDWVHMVELDGRTGREGGYTLEVLEKRYGAPVSPTR